MGKIIVEPLFMCIFKGGTNPTTFKPKTLIMSYLTENEGTAAEQFINFLYFANNFSPKQLNELFKSTNAPKHLESKFYTLAKSQNLNGTDTLLKWVMQLSKDNQTEVFNYVQNNYKNQ